MNNIQKMKELIERLNEANKAYYEKDEPIMSDLEYDRALNELTLLEKITGVHFADSPVGRIAGDKKQELETVRHTKPMLSCNKTKSIEDIIKFAVVNDTVISWKLDGLTLVLRYEKGRFTQAITRGRDGTEGEDVTHNVRKMRGIPLTVPCNDSFEVRGEGVLSWEDYNILNRLTETTSHPRNVASGSVRSFVPDEGKLAHIDFIAFELIMEDAPNSKTEQLDLLKKLNFNVVPHVFMSHKTPDEEIKSMIKEWVPADFKYPVDGMVFEYEDIEFGRSLGATAHHEKRMLALKWKDELKQTVFRGVDLHTTRTGKVSIIAKFDEVLIDGTRVHRASLHNLGIFESLRLGEGDIITVYKANMIVPQVADNLTLTGGYKLPEYCPGCGERLTVTVSPTGVRNLYCPNEDCISRNTHRFARFCDRKAMNIKGLHSSVLERLIAYGWVRSYPDLYRLKQYEDEIINTYGCGADFYNNLQTSVAMSRKCFLQQLLYALNIPLLSSEAAKKLHEYYYGSIDKLTAALDEHFPLSHIDGISSALEENIYLWYSEPCNRRMLNELLSELTILSENSYYSTAAVNALGGISIVLSGSTDEEKMPEIIRTFGIDVTNELNDDTKYLIYGDDPDLKLLREAEQRRISILTEGEFYKFIEFLSQS